MVSDMKTIKEIETEVFLKMAEENERLKTIIRHAASGRTDLFFICGQAGHVDEHGLPYQIMVCPALGSDGFAIYTKTSEYNAPGY